MTQLAKSKTCLVLILVMVLSSLFSIWPLPTARATSQQYSQIYIAPVKTCCSYGNTTYGVNEVFTVDVDLSLLSGQQFNGFDVRINYTNPNSGVSTGVLKATHIDYSSNVFSAYGNTIVEQCIDGVSVNNGVGCTTDVLGQVHFGQFVLGRTLKGPLTAQLFRVTFQVTGLGTSLFTIDHATVVNPTPDSSNPGLVSPQYIPVLKQTSIFSDLAGVTAFFDYQPDYSQDTILSPSLLPNQAVSFDSSNSFVANDSSMGFKLYAWNFGDGSKQNSTSSLMTHSFKLPGNYTVTLVAVDNAGQTGTITRIAQVLPALGNIALTVQDQVGTLQRGNVRVQVFNMSTSPTPFFNKTDDGNGQTTIYNLIPGSYYLTFSGPGIITGSKTETAIPGFTNQDTVHVSLIQQPPDYSGLIYLGTILGGLAIISGIIVYQKAKARREARKLRGQSVVSKPGKARKGRS